MFRLSLFNHLYKPFHHVRVIVREERTLLLIERSNPCHILISKGEIEHIHVLYHALIVGGFRNDHRVSLDMPAKDDLRRGLSVFCTDFYLVCMLSEKPKYDELIKHVNENTIR